MTKQEIVEKAFGQHWLKFKDLVDENGWVSDKDFWYMDAEDLFSIETESYYEYGYEMGVVRWRPNLIDELIMNNGWKIINSLEDLPPEYFKAHIVCNGIIIKECEHKGKNVWWSNLLSRTISNATHYRKIEELKLPLH